MTIHDRSAINDVTAVLASLKSTGINSQDPSGQTALQIAAHEGHVGLVQTLLALGADPNVRDKNGWNALHSSCSSASESRLEISRSLIIDGKVDTCAMTNSGASPIHYLLREAYCETSELRPLVELLIENGADVSIQNKYGETPLHQAVARGNMHSVRLLIELGAGLNINSKSGETPLHVAIRCGFPAVATVLIEHGADINERTLEGHSARDYCIRHHAIEISEAIDEKYGVQEIHLEGGPGSGRETGKLELDPTLIEFVAARGYEPGPIMSAMWQLHNRGVTIDISTLVNEIENGLSIDGDCKVCFDSQIDCVLFPCKHSCMCHECATTVIKDFPCPICRQPVAEVVKIFVS
eukprot:CAMPEP_0114619182 /NCGR_PEP_ID=MMETSP0168-20121206/8084_1 /TAXON_ID=95228 ORGANISM="Vannella sp., Strain DIVA3 517/6/12" /NCGR_SAMPLE_ID=MMETSP0168 /ASSEMBLY_ACC=CAM_ASM_000044 /LENGTH=352 /DNA_ID=CAMNT_0001830347 /DNA_START=152 /DNA_END=1210 /DNA_ORIENTATION=+